MLTLAGRKPVCRFETGQPASLLGSNRKGFGNAWSLSQIAVLERTAELRKILGHC